jgi:zinc protease
LRHHAERLLPPDELNKELDVIRREMDMNQDDPGRRAGRRLFESAYTKSPYRFTIIGYPDIFNTLKPEDILGYYREQYVPNNIFFVVTGDIKTAEVTAQIRQAYAQTKARAIAAVGAAARTAPNRPARHHRGSSHRTGLFSFRLAHPGHPASRHAGAGYSGRAAGQRPQFPPLPRSARKKGPGHSADAWTYSPGEQGLFGMSAVMAADKFAAARDAMLEEVERVQKKPVPAAELAKVIKQFAASTLATRKTMQGQAQDLGSKLDGGQRPEFFRALSGRRAPGDSGPCSAWRANT